MVAVVGRSTTVSALLAHAARAAVRRRRPHRRARRPRLHRLGPLGRARRHAGRPRRVPRPRGRRPGAVPDLPAGARRRLHRGAGAGVDAGAATRPRRGRRPGRLARSGAAALPGARVGAAALQPDLGEVGGHRAAAEDVRAGRGQRQRVDGQDHRARGVRRLLAGPADPVGVDVAGPVATRRRGAGAACRAAASAPAPGRRARPAPAPARRSPRRSPTGWCRRSGCRAPAPRSRPSARRPASSRLAADRAAEHRVVPVHRERRLVQEQVAVLAQRVAEPAARRAPTPAAASSISSASATPARSAWKMLELPASSASALTCPPASCDHAMPPNGSCSDDHEVERPAHGRPAAAHERLVASHQPVVPDPDREVGGHVGLAAGVLDRRRATSFIGHEPSSRCVARHQS